MTTEANLKSSIIKNLTEFFAMYQSMADTLNEYMAKTENQEQRLTDVERWIHDKAVQASPEITDETTSESNTEDLLIRVLGIIKSKGPRLTAREIAEEIKMSTWSANESTRKLQKKGLILKGRGEYRLTDRGKKRLKEINAVKIFEADVALKDVRKNLDTKDVRSTLRHEKDAAIHIAPVIPIEKTHNVKPSEQAIEINSTLAAIASACDCKVKDQRGRDLLRHMVTSPKVNYDTMTAVLGGSNFSRVAMFLRHFIDNGSVTRQKLQKGNHYLYSVNEKALVDHTNACEIIAKCVPKNEQTASTEKRNRLEFVNHMRTYGTLKGFTEQQHQDAFNQIYGLLGAIGIDPRGKRDEDGKKMKPVDWLEKNGCAGDALKLARTHYPLPA